MGSTKEEQDRVRSLLLDTVTLLCKNGLNFKKQLKVQGLLGITLDEDDVFIVHINEKVGELIVEHQKKDDSDESSIDSTPAKVHRKRRSDSSPMYKGPPDKIRIKTEKEDPDGADLILIDENECDDKSKIQKTIVQHQQQQPGLHSITNFQTGYQHFNQQNNMQTGPGYMTSTNVVPHQNMPQTGQPTPEKLWKGLHVRRSPHGPNKNFVCDVPSCCKAYYDKRNLLRHQREKHGMHISGLVKSATSEKRKSAEYSCNSYTNTSDETNLNSDAFLDINSANFHVETLNQSALSDNSNEGTSESVILVNVTKGHEQAEYTQFNVKSESHLTSAIEGSCSDLFGSNFEHLPDIKTNPDNAL